ncbi:hypothetical protein ACTID9_22935 [Brevibacillus fluminis]|uniref:hypothetical protein n=1 Tax=Brevibacillus fluminis TaxID=511487 RepID=UPI003F890F87
MWVFIGLLSFVCIFVFLVLSLIAALRKTGQAKKHLKLSGACFIIFIFALILSPSNNHEASDKVDSKSVQESTEPEKTSPETTSPATSEQATQAAEPQTTEATPVSTQVKQEPAKEPDKPKNEIPGTIGMNPEQFQKAFNKVAKDNKIDLKISKITVEKGDAQDTFQYKFTKNLALLGTVNKKDGSIRDITLLGTGDGSFKSGADIMLGISLMIASTNPELPPDERGAVLEDLGLIGGEGGIMGLHNETIRNGMKYTIMTSEQLGIWFIVGDANEKK